MEYIEPPQLAAILLSDEAQKVKIIDVRDEDFEGGHIVGAVNAPSAFWTEDSFVDSMISSYAGAETVVFHCMKSQQRGPTCARRFAARLEARDDVHKPEVKVLRGGYSVWGSLYADESKLNEK